MYCHQEALLSTYPKETEKEKTLNWGLKNMFKIQPWYWKMFGGQIKMGKELVRLSYMSDCHTNYN